MIKRTDDVWTTIQCKNLVSDDGKKCNLCFKVLNDRFALTQQCPYCLGKIDLRPWLKEEAAQVSTYQHKYANLDPDDDTLAAEAK